MASLRELLAKEGFEKGKHLKSQKLVNFKDRSIAPEYESIAVPIYICHDRKGYEKQQVTKASKKNRSSKRLSTDSERTSSKSLMSDGPAMDDVAIRAVISILVGYIGRYINDGSFREKIRANCKSCLLRRRKNSDNMVFADMELGMESIDKLVAERPSKVDLRMKSLTNSIQLLSIVASLNSNNSRNGTTCGVPNSHLSACAQFYLSIVYKLENNSRISARHLLQVFCDAPFFARTHLFPDLWEQFFLPHLLHIKNWYQEEIEFIKNLDSVNREKRMEGLRKVYDEQMDTGTVKFALYYKEWLKTGVTAPSIPDVNFPSRPSYGPSMRRKSSDSYSSQSSINKNLYQTVFGHSLERRSMDVGLQNRNSIHKWTLEEEEEEEEKNKMWTPGRSSSQDMWTHRRSSSNDSKIPRTEPSPQTQRLGHFQFLSCQSVLIDCLVNGNVIPRDTSIRREVYVARPLSDLSSYTTTLCSSDNLSECEIAIRQIAKAWLDSQGAPTIEAAISRAQVIEGILEVLFASKDDEILELAISILAELVSRNEGLRETILNSDPQLEIFMVLLSSTSLFLKAAVLLYLLKPNAKEMVSVEWIPLVLRVLEFGDQLQTLFTVRRSPQVAALYFLDQLLTGFEEDGKIENAVQLVALWGLNLLIRSIEKGDISERNNTASILSRCIRADGSCRNYLVNNLNKASLLELIVLGIRQSSKGCAFVLLTDLLCLSRTTQIIKFLEELNSGWGGLSTTQIFLVYLQRAPPEERPLVAAVLLQLDLLGDHLRCSVYREQAVDAIISSLDCKLSNESVQEQAAIALFMLGAHFSRVGEATEEEWLLQHTDFRSKYSYNGQEIAFDEDLNEEEEEEVRESLRRKLAIALFNSGGKRFLDALTNAIANSTLNLARASLFTVAWMSSFFNSIGDENFQSVAYATLVPQLLESTNSERILEENLLASFSLQHFVKSSAERFASLSRDTRLREPLSNPC
ncbi:putative E3 ubiquitin-protein ligase LIN-1 isoform X1 [Tripterygium wilfordii]|uniref:putative E3 ubiquitin-protein ligase LIN-1 isoform X1 n=1 Tax=Tripterygium wilfordii TaxID=458696 RepID=UPI0018F80540|nr:putative E3 ubiquitin-protein ligase LIN-1 isoform X1 [Tripterygium wilfordii]